MVLDLVVISSDDGYTAEVPTIKGCESWAHNEEDAITKTVELLVFYLNLNDSKNIKVDKARKSKHKSIYKLFFEK